MICNTCQWSKPVKTLAMFSTKSTARLNHTRPFQPASFWKFGLAVAIPSFTTPSETALYGATQAFDIQHYYFGERHSYELMFQRYQGFYLEDPKGEVYGIYPALTTYSLGANYIFQFDRNFSLSG